MFNFFYFFFISLFVLFVCFLLFVCFFVVFFFLYALYEYSGKNCMHMCTIKAHDSLKPSNGMAWPVGGSPPKIFKDNRVKDKFKSF